MIELKNLRHLTSQELSKVAGQLRHRIIDVCSKNGGHIGASLGAVELTLALHSELESPKDTIVWDVGHQTYAHKILTGRDFQFQSLRKRGGVSGFTSRAESEHDAFGAGHSSTSISAAVGIAEAKRITGDNSWTVAVIGDGGLTAGLAFEAINQAGTSAEPRLLIVINDNNLSISANVGALNRWAFGTEREPRKFFESLGFNYIGPIDGHDIDAMRSRIKEVKHAALGRVTVLHVLTVKGKGFEPAEKDPVRFHGVGPFDKITGRDGATQKTETFSQVFSKKLTELAARDPKIVALTAAMAEGTGLKEFALKHPDRFYDVGIAEAHSLVFAAGLATKGLKPVAAIYSTFLQRAVDSAIHDVALQNLDVVVGVDRAGLVGADGPTHHGLFDVAIFRAVPNVMICAPATANELEAMLEAAIAQRGLKLIRYPRGAAPRETSSSAFEWGKARLVSGHCETAKLSVWALGTGVTWALEAAALLPEELRESISIVDARFVKPIDAQLLKQSLAAANALMTLEDASIAGGFGSALLEEIAGRGLRMPEKIVQKGIPDCWVGHAEIKEQRQDHGLSPQALASTMKELLNV